MTPTGFFMQKRMPIGYRRLPDALRLFAWHDVDNFGDRLGPALFHLLSGRSVYIEARGLRLVFNDGSPRNIHCFLGTMAQFLSGPHHFILWGFGTAPAEGPAHHGCRPIEGGLDLDIRALRGPLTADVLSRAGYSVPADTPFGDPGLLAPAFYLASEYKVDDFCLVPHHSEYEAWRERFPGFNVIDIRTTRYETLAALVTQITKYRAVFSSSLHVTILAEAFGIPTRPVEPRLPFKFDDFYAGVGKSMDHVTQATPATDWPALYRDTVDRFQPISWDPAAWLAKAPFPIDQQVTDRLTRHYADLHPSGDQLGASVALPAVLQKHYAVLCKSWCEDAATTNSDAESATVLHAIDFVSRRGTWAEIQNIFATGHAPNAGGAIFTYKKNSGYGATAFIDVNDRDEITVSWSFTGISGVLELILQDETFHYLDSLLLTEGSAAETYTLRFTPTRATKVRAVAILLRGSFTIRRLEIAARA